MGVSLLCRGDSPDGVLQPRPGSLQVVVCGDRRNLRLRQQGLGVCDLDDAPGTCLVASLRQRQRLLRGREQGFGR